MCEFGIDDEILGIMRARIRAGEWTQRNGVVINVKDMSDRHIENTIAMLKRGNSVFKGAWIARLEKEQKRREEQKHEYIHRRRRINKMDKRITAND